VKTVQMPRWVAAFLVIATMSSLMLAAFAITSYTLVKPFTVSITTAPCPLSITSMSFTYDPNLNQWTSCTVQINNPTTSPVSATVYVYLKNATASTIAFGQHAQTFPAGNTVVTVALNWVEGATADDVAGGYAVIQP